MFKIYERSFYNGADVTPPEYIVNDFADSYARNQFKRVFHRPLVTKELSNKDFTSWKGRCVCVVRFCHNLVREPFRFLKNIVIVMIVSLNAFLQLINAPFSKSARSGLNISLIAPFEATAGVLLRPFGFFVDMFQLACGAAVHPTMAIK